MLLSGNRAVCNVVHQTTDFPAPRRQAGADFAGFVTIAIVNRDPIGLHHFTGGNIRNGAPDKHLREFQRLNMHDIFALHNSAFEQRTGARE
jgi:hypothetical protein